MAVMMARSKAARRRQKRGRPRLLANGHDREQNGRLSRRKNATEGRAMDVVLNRRIRQQGIIGNSDEPIEKQAADPRRGYVLGILLLGDRINQTQHDAGLKYGADLNRHYKLSGLPDPLLRAQDMFAVHGTSSETIDQALAAKLARKRAKELRDVLLAIGDIGTGRRVEHTVRSVCLLDLPDSAFTGRVLMSNLLIRGLNGLARYYSGMPPA
jgi:hypothetical protein